MPEIPHRFLFQEGVWTVRGRYYDSAGQPLACDGEARITHQENLWINEGRVRILVDPPVHFSHRYEVVPLAGSSEMTTWSSVNSNLGRMQGRLVVVFDSLTSTFQSENGEFWGSEIMIQVGPSQYQNRGFACRKDEKLSSWAMELTLVED